MTTAFASAVDFGRLLVAINSALTEGAALPDILEKLRADCEACAVSLRLERPGTATKSYFDRQLESAANEACALPCDYLEARQAQYALTRLSCESPDKRSQLTLCLYRNRSEGAFDPQDMEMLQVILSLIANTMALSVRLRHQKVEASLYSNALESLHVGVVLLTADGKVHTTSPLARQMLYARNGITASSGRLRAVEAGEDRNLQSAIEQICKQVSEGSAKGVPPVALALTKKSGSRGLGIIVRAVDPEAAMGSGAKVAVYIRDSEVAPELQSEYVRQIFDLTPAEAAVTHRLTAGLSLEDAASSLQISRNTARAHLRSIFLKNGITRQTDLVRMVLNSAATLCDSRQMQRAN